MTAVYLSSWGLPPSFHRYLVCANHVLSLQTANWLELHFRMNGSSVSYTTMILSALGRGVT